MSFWKTTLFGGSSNDTLPDSTVASKTVDSSPPRAQKEDEPKVVLGPPPTATAYTHTTAAVSPLKPKVTRQQELPPPQFQIFEPKQEDEQTEASESPKDVLAHDGPTRDTSEEPPEQHEPSALGDSNAENSRDAEPSLAVNEQPEEDWEFEEDPAEKVSHNDDDDGVVVEENASELVQDKIDFWEGRHREEDQDVAIANQPDDVANMDSNQENAIEASLGIQQEIPFMPQDVGESSEQPQVTPEVTLSPKFDFVNESVPLQKLQDSASKRRHESLSRIHDLDCSLASLQAKLEHESMDRALALNVDRLDPILYQPLESTVERFTSHVLPNNGAMHSRLLKLETEWTMFANQQFPDAISEQLESPHQYLSQELQARLTLEKQKADNREGTMVRRFESIAGTAARRHVEETASRKASLKMVQSLAQEAADMDEQYAMKVLSTLKELREALRQEREERKAQDERVMNLIVERTTELKRALLEAADYN